MSISTILHSQTVTHKTATQQDEEQLQMIKSHTCSDDLSIEEYISIQTSNNTTNGSSSPVFTENNSSNITTTTNNSSRTNILSHNTTSTTNTSISQQSFSNSINGKPIVYNQINDTNNLLLLGDTQFDLNKDLFYCIDRKPTYPPNYHNINLVKSIKFPIYESISPVNKNEKPPDYTPAVYKFTIASLKLERLSPYEPSTSRAWKDYIVEINSTQLNFYTINDSLSTEIKNLKSSHPINSNNNNNIQSSSSHSPKTKKSNGFFSSIISKDTQTLELNEQDQMKICSYINKNKLKYMSPQNLIKSYSLQYAKYGVPTDYDKRQFVLRLRCESEQFLINFNHIDDMINWAMYLSIGISVSLDLEFRQLPDYRVVPRRRRRRRRRHRNGHNKKKTTTFKRTHSNNSVIGQRNRASSVSNSISQTKSRSYSLSSIRSGLNPTNFRRSSAASHHSMVPERQNHITTPKNLNEIEQLLSIPTDDNASFTSSNSRRGSIITSSRTNNSNLHSRSNSSSTSLNLSFKSKMKSLFKSNKSLSNDTTREGSIKFGSAVSNSSYSKEGQTYTRNRSISIAVIPNSSDCIPSRKSTYPNDLRTKQNRSSETRITESVINELQEHPTHPSNEDDISDEEEEDDTVYNSTDDHLTDEGDTDYDDHFNSTTDTNLSIYAEEGLLHDESDDDDESDDEIPLSSNDTMDSSIFEGRLNNMGPIGYSSYDSDDVKWAPDKKEMTRRRYIRDSIRCIKPLVEDQEWLNHIVFRPTREPKFKTNNPPIWIGDNDGKAKFKYLSSSDFSNVKNHYLRAYVVGPVGFLKADTKIVTTPVDLII